MGVLNFVKICKTNFISLVGLLNSINILLQFVLHKIDYNLVRGSIYEIS